jgi:hypothetical protein
MGEKSLNFLLQAIFTESERDQEEKVPIGKPSVKQSS